MDLGTLHKNIVYKNQGTPYSLTRTITKMDSRTFSFIGIRMLN